MLNAMRSFLIFMHGLIYFYIGKCYKDLMLVETANINNTPVDIKDLFTENGLDIYFEIKNKFNFIREKWGNILSSLNMSNQPYNFTYSKFVELNPLDENNN